MVRQPRRVWQKWATAPSLVLKNKDANTYCKSTLLVDQETQRYKYVNSPKIDYGFKAHVIIVSPGVSLEIEADLKVILKYNLELPK